MTTPFTRSNIERLSSLACSGDSTEQLAQTVAILRDMLAQVLASPIVFQNPTAAASTLTDIEGFPELGQYMPAPIMWAISTGEDFVQPSADNVYTGIVWAKPCHDIYGNHVEATPRPFFLSGIAGTTYSFAEGYRFPYCFDRTGRRVVVPIEGTGDGGGGEGEDATYQHDGSVIGQQPNLNFVDAGCFTWTVTEEAGSDRVNVEFDVDIDCLGLELEEVDAIYSENGTVVGQRPELNFNDTSLTGEAERGIGFTATDNVGEDRVDVEAYVQPYQARWIEFEQSGSASSSEFTATVIADWEGYDPGGSVSVIDSAGLLEEDASEDADRGIACYSPDADKYVVVGWSWDVMDRAFAMRWYENDSLVATRRKANFVDSSTVVWSLSDDGGNGWVEIEADTIVEAIGFRGILAGAISSGVGSDVSVDAEYGPVGAISSHSGTQACLNPFQFDAPAGAMALVLRKLNGDLDIVNVTCGAVD